MRALLFVTILSVALATPAVADSFTDAFPSDDSTVTASVGTITAGEYGYFWSVGRGDKIEETFTGTGLSSVVQLDLEFEVTQNFLNSGASTMWDVSVNGTKVGDWEWSDTDGTGTVSLSYSFAAIAGAGTYTILMDVTNEVAGGQGSIAIGYPGDMTLTSAVPEPGTLALLGLGILGLGLHRRRASKVRPS